MPKGIDPKAYAARITRAKKTVAAMDPATRAKIKDMYPKVTKETVANSALNPKKAAMKKQTPRKPAVSKSPSKAVKKPLPKIVGAKPGARRLLPRDPNAAPSPRRLLANTTTSASGRTAAKPKVAKRAPLETKRIGGIFAVPAKPKKTIY
jgi:hypothetical protein